MDSAGRCLSVQTHTEAAACFSFLACAMTCRTQTLCTFTALEHPHTHEHTHLPKHGCQSSQGWLQDRLKEAELLLTVSEHAAQTYSCVYCWVISSMTSRIHCMQESSFVNKHSRNKKDPQSLRSVVILFWKPAHRSRYLWRALSWIMVWSVWEDVQHVKCKVAEAMIYFSVLTPLTVKALDAHSTTFPEHEFTGDGACVQGGATAKLEVKYITLKLFTCCWAVIGPLLSGKRVQQTLRCMRWSVVRVYQQARVKRVFGVYCVHALIQKTRSRFIPHTYSTLKVLTPAERKWATPEGRVSKDAFNCNLSDELVTLVTDKGERLAGQVKPLGQDLVAVVRETRVLTGNWILSWKERWSKKKEERAARISFSFSTQIRGFCVRARLTALRWRDSGIISTPSSRWWRADWYGALAFHLHIKRFTQTLTAPKTRAQL